MKKYFSILLVSIAIFGGSSFYAHKTQAATQTTKTVETKTAVQAAPQEIGLEATQGAGETGKDTGIIGMFGLNWKLFLAQLVNFTIVLFVLWKWVFKPVTKGLSDRTEKIEDSLQEAERIMKDRADFDSWKQGEISTVRTEASAIISQAKQTAEALKAETLKTTTAEQNRLIEQTKELMAQEKTMMIDSAKSELAGIVVQATSTILKVKIDPAKDKQLIDDALKSAAQMQGAK